MVLDLRQGDSFKLLDSLPENSVDTIICDPPYGLSFMGKKWDYDVPSVVLWEKCLRVLKPGGTALIFAGSRTQHRMAVNVEDAGFLLKDTMMWMYGSGFPKALDISKAFDKDVEREVVGYEEGTAPDLRDVGRQSKENAGVDKLSFGQTENVDRTTIPITIPTTEQAKKWNGWKSHGLKPAYEPILVAMKPNEENYVTNALNWDVSGLYIDGCRIPFEKTKNAATNPMYRFKNDYKQVTDHGQNIGPNVTFTNSLNPPSQKGRFPTNVILECTCEKTKTGKADGSAGHWADTDVSGFGEKTDYHGVGEKADMSCVVHTDPNCPCRILDDQSGISKSSDTERNRNTLGSFGMPNDDTPEYNDKGGASRFFYQAKASKSERNMGCEDFDIPDYRWNNAGEMKDITGKKGNFHPTVKPIALMEYLCNLTKTPTGGVVLDPFMGSGSTGMACQLAERDFIGFELDEEYFKLAKSRIEKFDVRKWRGQWVEEEDQMGLDEWL